MRTRLVAYLIGASLSASSLHAPAAAQGGPAPAPAASSATIERNGYVQLHVTVRITGSSALGFTGCPRSSYAGIDFGDLLKGDQTYTLGLQVEMPSSLPPLLLTPVQIEHDKQVFGEKCRIRHTEVDFRSPLFFVDQYRDKSFVVTPTVTQRIKWSDSFGQAVTGAVDAAKAFSSVPAPALASGLQIFTNIAATQGDDDLVASGKPLAIREGAAPAAAVWEIPAETGKLPKIEIRAELVPVSSIFADELHPQPSALLGTTFQIREPAPQLGIYLKGLAPIQTLVTAQNVDQFQAACVNAANEVSGLGLDFGDRALVMWALARDHARLGNDPAVDHTPCMASMFAMSPKAQNAPVIAARSLQPDAAAPSADQMRLAIVPGLATFLSDTDWMRRRQAGAGFLREPMEYADPAGLRVIRAQSVTLANIDQWYAQSHAIDQPLATRVGCLIFRPGSPQTPSQAAVDSRAIGVASFNARDNAGVVQEREAIFRMTFAAARPGEPARVSRLEIDPNPTETEIAAIRADPANQYGCGQGWRPSLIFPS